ncbi:DALR anticodon binding, partial [Sesbania bispinosa]
NGNIVLDHEDERALGLHLVQFPEVFVESCSNLLPNVLCEYLYNLAEIFTKKFYSNCQVVGSPEESSRLLLCEATTIVMRQCFYLLGIEPVYNVHFNLINQKFVNEERLPTEIKILANVCRIAVLGGAVTVKIGITESECDILERKKRSIDGGKAKWFNKKGVKGQGWKCNWEKCKT